MTGLTWIRTSPFSEVAEVPGGRLALHTDTATVQVVYQSDRPTGMSPDSLKQVRNSQRPDNRRYWEIGAIAPGWSMGAGGFRDAALAKDLLDRAIARLDGLNGGRALESAGYRITTTDSYGGIRWVRRTGRRSDVVVTNEHRVYALIEPQGMKNPTIVFDLALDNRVVERGLGVKPVSVHYVWPAFMATIDALTLMAIDALNRAS